MPIVVRELVIRARVEDVESGPAANGPKNRAARRTGIENADIECIVALCVERALAAIERKKER